MPLREKLKAVSPELGAQPFAGLNVNQLVALFGQFVSGEKIALLQLFYPVVDRRNHKSQQALVDRLNSHGMQALADLVDKQTPFIVTSDLKLALTLCREIQNDSLALGVTLHFDGATGMAAENRLAGVVYPDEHVSLNFSARH